MVSVDVKHHVYLPTGVDVHPAEFGGGRGGHIIPGVVQPFRFEPPRTQEKQAIQPGVRTTHGLGARHRTHHQHQGGWGWGGGLVEWEG